eukprot:CAMPEP_0181256150 /NCGR_PEP_ID=MMETSP1096-20121128/49550_1 /TAXON_ID=156174 ORGANISM="Chrysochromulina ericina, Strain CCMP281" /NCGR_SAMPLE_ID=MMETSP1096 /ASSEMBLY_ACC=CAM_ASM_000453 /LENGTH=197 /DNA_ID=CAMNT_0023354367 /DNA_START=148 /DNA_END=743 /DNA_ORIENTATION=+
MTPLVCLLCCPMWEVTIRRIAMEALTKCDWVVAMRVEGFCGFLKPPLRKLLKLRDQTWVAQLEQLPQGGFKKPQNPSTRIATTQSHLVQRFHRNTTNRYLPHRATKQAYQTCRAQLRNHNPTVPLAFLATEDLHPCRATAIPLVVDGAEFQSTGSTFVREHERHAWGQQHEHQRTTTHSAYAAKKLAAYTGKIGVVP